MNAISAQVAGWWNRMEQKILLAILKGIFGEALKDSNVNDISASTGAAGVINGLALLDTKQLFGDAAGSLSALFMHSAVFTALQKKLNRLYSDHMHCVTGRDETHGRRR
jgi:hypothetical protein